MTLFERLSEPYLLLDDRLEFISANASWRALFGASAMVVDGKLGSEGDLPELIRVLTRELRPGQPAKSGVFPLDAGQHAQDAAASPRYWQIHASVLPAANDEPEVIALRFEDVTVRTRAEEEERRERARWRSQVRLHELRSKEGELSPDNLDPDAVASAERAARERIDASAKAMDQFIAAVSHELRSPLNAIVSWAELLQLGDPVHVARAGDAIRRNGRQLSHMVDDLLDSGAVATGKLSVNLRPVDLGALAAIVAEDMRKAAGNKGLELHAADIASCIVMADESRMKQVVWNLLTNAVKFTSAGKIDVSVTAVEGHAEMTVRDSGQGIDAEALPRIFERFQQIAPQSSGRVGGLGLGLWLVKHIVELHDGTIEAASAGKGAGTTFIVRLPLASQAGR